MRLGIARTRLEVRDLGSFDASSNRARAVFVTRLAQHWRIMAEVSQSVQSIAALRADELSSIGVGVKIVSVPFNLSSSITGKTVG